MTADELHDCMSWMSPPPPEECPALKVTAPLNQAKRFGGTTGQVDVNGIWSVDGLYLEGVNASFSNDLFESSLT